MPQIDDLLDLLGSATYSTLDLASGYWQIPLEKESKCKTAFTLSQGLYQFKIMLFCLFGTLATFQCLVHWLLRPYVGYAMVYLDNIIYSPDGESPLKHMELVTGAIAKAI